MHYLWNFFLVMGIIYMLDVILGRPGAVLVVSAAVLGLIVYFAVRRNRPRPRDRDLTY